MCSRVQTHTLSGIRENIYLSNNAPRKSVWTEQSKSPFIFKHLLNFDTITGIEEIIYTNK